MKMRQKMRERVQPKMGKLNIDYQKLHDAFFKYQEKPALTSHGDMCVFGPVCVSARTQSLTRAGRWGGAGRAGTTRARSLRPSTRTSDQASSRPSCGYVCRRRGCQRFRHDSPFANPTRLPVQIGLCFVLLVAFLATFFLFVR